MRIDCKHVWEHISAYIDGGIYLRLPWFRYRIAGEATPSLASGASANSMCIIMARNFAIAPEISCPIKASKIFVLKALETPFGGRCADRPSLLAPLGSAIMGSPWACGLAAQELPLNIDKRGSHGRYGHQYAGPQKGSIYCGPPCVGPIRPDVAGSPEGRLPAASIRPVTVG